VTTIAAVWSTAHPCGVARTSACRPAGASALATGASLPCFHPTWNALASPRAEDRKSFVAITHPRNDAVTKRASCMAGPPCEGQAIGRPGSRV
jgi:hypothetical protein